ncbi:MAG: glycoside hydrolase family 97 catalytic domain-containing protein, partial [Prolixibacteraceae bacterium]|nr:glycoside hydrolase family 97 catalytic domain-containing protein [Prolixibacteraceae bacterium]
MERLVDRKFYKDKVKHCCKIFGKVAFVCILLQSGLLHCLGNTHEIISPDKNVQAKIYCNNNDYLKLEVSRGGRQILYPSPLGIIINDLDLGQNAKIFHVKKYEINETYPWNGNHSQVVNHCFGTKLKLKTEDVLWTLDLRVYNDGIAFKYSLERNESFFFNGESTVLHFNKTLKSKYMQHKMSEESRVFSGSINDIAKSNKKRTLPPILFYPEDESEYIMLLEGGGFEFHGFSLLPVKKPNIDYNTTPFKVEYAEELNGWEINGKLETAWKIICAVDNLNELFNTDLVANVCPAPDVELFPNGINEDWIKPGKSTWNWWARVGVEYENQIKLVDLAAKIGADYHLVDIGWDQKWKDDKKSSYEYLNDLCNYAAGKGIGIFVWKTSDVSLNMELLKDSPKNKFVALKDFEVSADPEKMRAEIKRIADAGAKGIKLDYIQSENSYWKSYMVQFLKIAAEYKLLVDFHVCPTPAGESKTFPNEITREAIFGGEKIRGGGGAKKVPASQYIDLLFTRGIAGPADFTPGIFNQLRADGLTNAMQLAAAMMFTSPFLCWADHPDFYLKSKGLE